MNSHIQKVKNPVLAVVSPAVSLGIPAGLGEEELNTSSLGSTDLATHALVFFVRGAVQPQI
jgi:hypothetical protein